MSDFQPSMSGMGYSTMTLSAQIILSGEVGSKSSGSQNFLTTDAGDILTTDSGDPLLAE